MTHIRLPAVLALDDDLRVRSDAATPDDLDQAARYLEQEAERKLAEGTELAAALRKLAAMARERGLAHVAELGDLPPADLDQPV